MPSNMPQSPPEAFFTEQVINLTVWNGTAVTTVPLPVDYLTHTYHWAVSIAISYGAQVGACIVMLLVALTMTPRIKFARLNTLVNVASLAVGVVRNVLLARYYAGSDTDFYNLFSGDYRFVDRSGIAANATGTALAVPQLLLITAALMIQAWSMLQLWEPPYRWAAAGFSVALSGATIAFKIAAAVSEMRFVLHDIDDMTPYVYQQKAELVLLTASIAWYCFTFNVRLVTHMWEHRSFLPSTKAVSPMEVLVMTNGILMIVPTIFAGLAFASFDYFDSGSWTFTSVIVVLPLGTLVAQRIAAPSAFSTLEGGSHASSQGSTAIASSAAGGSDVPFLRSWKRIGSSRRGSSAGAVLRGGGNSTTGVTSVVSGGTRAMDPIDVELAQIDSHDLEKGAVRVERKIERREERF